MPTKLQPPPLHINCRKGEGTTILVWLGWLTSLFFAMNIGASAAAASMGSVYGAHVLRRRTALLLVAIFSLLGAYFGGGEVIKTISGGIVDGDRIDLPGAVAIIASAAMTLLVANLWGVPLSTSEVTVGAVIGAGLVVGGIRSAEVTRIVLTWAIFPFAALAASFLLTRLLLPPIARRLRGRHGHMLRRLLALALLAGGCYEAFAAGMNNVANAVGPLVAAGMVDARAAQLYGGLFLAMGALLFGARVLETNGKRITALSLVSGSIVSFSAATLVVLSSLEGIPVPLTQATTVGIIGTGLAVHGRRGINAATVRRVLFVWTVSPIAAMSSSYLTLRWVVAATQPGAAAAGSAAAPLMAAAVLLGLGLLMLAARRRRGRATAGPAAGTVAAVAKTEQAPRLSGD